MIRYDVDELEQAVHEAVAGHKVEVTGEPGYRKFTIDDTVSVKVTEIGIGLCTNWLHADCIDLEGLSAMVNHDPAANVEVRHKGNFLAIVPADTIGLAELAAQPNVTVEECHQPLDLIHPDDRHIDGPFVLQRHSGKNYIPICFQNLIECVNFMDTEFAKRKQCAYPMYLPSLNEYEATKDWQFGETDIYLSRTERGTH